MFRKTITQLIAKEQQHILQAQYANNSADSYNKNADYYDEYGATESAHNMRDNAAQCIGIANWHLKRANRYSRRIERRLTKLDN